MFYSCTGLTSIIIPDSVTVIGDYSFYNCTSLTSIIIPDSVTVIGNYLFYECTGLTNIILPDSVTVIGGYSFVDCTSLTNVIIPDNVTHIGEAAFSNCIGLTSVIIPDSVIIIWNYVFYYCTSLVSITFNSPTTIINDSKNTIPPTAKIIGYDSSTAKDYAVKYNRTFTLIKADPAYTTPTGLSASYGQTLADISLPTAVNGTFSWEDALSTDVGNAGTNYFNVTFTPADTANYNTINGIEVAVDVGKVTPTITADPIASPITYGQTLADSILTGGTASVDGSFAWTDGSIAPAVSDSGITLYSVTFTPTDTVNYESVTTEISVIVEKASPIIILEDYNAVYTGNIIKINDAEVILANNETYNGSITYTYYTDKDCTN